MTTPSEFKKYLKEMARRIKTKRARWSAYREIRNHLLSKLENLMKSGLSREQALNITLKEATCPKRLGKSISQSGRPWFWRYPLITLSIATPLLIITFLSITSHLLINEYYLPNYKSHFDIPPEIKNLFEADLKLLSEKNIFPPSKELYNASAFFVHKTPLHSNGMYSPKIWQQRETINDILSYKNLNDDPTKLNDPQSAMSLQLDWIEQFMDYDHWNLYANYESDKAQKDQPHGPALPMSDFIFVEKVTVIYALQKIKTGDGAAALKLMRHVAHLLFTTQSTRGQKSSLNLLRIEHILANKFNLNTSQLVSFETLDAYKRVFSAWNGIFQQHYFEGKIDSRWQPYLKKNLGICPVLKESAFNISFMGDYFGNKIFTEPSFNLATQRSSEQRKKLLSECDLRGLLAHQNTQSYINTPNWEVSLWEMYIKHPPSRPEPYKSLTIWLPKPSAIPFLRRIAGIYLVNLNRANAFAAYKATTVKDF